MSIPEAKLPPLTLPTIDGLPTIPHVGCAGGDGTSYLGKKFGNAPDLHRLLHLKALQKVLGEQMYALLKGELTDIPRAAAYAARLATLTSEVADMVSAITETINDLTANINDAISYVDQQVAAVNSAKNMIEGVPDAARSAVQRLMFENYGRYVQELNAQKTRLQSAITCIAS